MNCLLETVASMWLMTRKAVGVQSIYQRDENVQESLEECRISLEEQEKEMAEACRWIGQEALKKRQTGDSVGAMNLLRERRRKMKRLEKLRNNLTLVVGQIDALRSVELDRELMRTLQVSSAALKQAGVGTGVKDAEEVMTQLEDQMRQSSELTSVLSGPLQDDMEFDMEEEFDALMQDVEANKAPGTVNSTREILVSPPVSVKAPVGPAPTALVAEVVLPTRVPQLLF
jgi:hypothetical protein